MYRLARGSRLTRPGAAAAGTSLTVTASPAGSWIGLGGRTLVVSLGLPPALDAPFCFKSFRLSATALNTDEGS